MILELAISTGMVVTTVTMHGTGLYLLGRWLRVEARVEAREQAMSGLHPRSVRHLLFLVAAVLGLFVIHGIEIWSYALLYLSLDALPDLRAAVYFSTITYATIGYDDEGLREAYQLIAAIEGVNGVILMGWSTAFFITVVAQLGRR